MERRNVPSIPLADELLAGVNGAGSKKKNPYEQQYYLKLAADYMRNYYALSREPGAKTALTYFTGAAEVCGKDPQRCRELIDLADTEVAALDANDPNVRKTVEILDTYL